MALPGLFHPRSPGEAFPRLAGLFYCWTSYRGELAAHGEKNRVHLLLLHLPRPSLLPFCWGGPLPACLPFSSARTNRQVSGRVTARRSLSWTACKEAWKMHDECPLLDGGSNQPSDSEGTSLVSHRGGQLLGSNALQIPPRSLEEKGPSYPASRKGF